MYVENLQEIIMWPVILNTHHKDRMLQIMGIGWEVIGWDDVMWLYGIT